MILGDPETAVAAIQQSWRRVTIDDVFRRVAAKNPDRLALADPPNREAFTDGAARRLTYAQAERTVVAIADRLRRMGIATDAVVGIQLPNTIENVLTILAVLRAGMIAAPLPLLWRRVDATSALSRVGAKALITCARVGSVNYYQSAMRIASEVFSIRCVGGFGGKPADGVVPFDDLFDVELNDPLPPVARERQSDAAAHVGLITFETGEAGTVPVARNHAEMLTGGLAVTLEARLAQQSRILSTLAPASFAAVSLTLMPWLLSAGTLHLHHPFDPDVFERQRRDEDCATLILPAEVALRLAEAYAFAGDGVGTVIAAWRSPEFLATSRAWRERDAALADVSIFGEAGFVAARRRPDGRPAPLPLGAMVAPRGNGGAAGGALIAELVRTPQGTLGLRGPMVPRHAFPPGIERSGLPHFAIDRSGLVDTGYGCRVDSISKGVVITGPPAGIVSVGGYRFALHELVLGVGRVEAAATIAALPDPVIGQRLIGNSQRREMVQAALNAVGANPLLSAAFHDRSMRLPAGRGR